MKPETLKLIAEALRGEVREVDYGKGLVMYAKCDGGWDEWNPTNNAEQREEILLWLLDKGWRVTNDFAGRYHIDSESIGFVNKDYTTALLQAAEHQVNRVKEV